MKVSLISFVFFLSSFFVRAQQVHFIYLQTENKQPFFVKVNDKVFSSSPLGYLIIPKLDNGFYSLIVGFPQSTTQQEFNCSINNKDIGFLIKNNGENSWVLYNLQNQSTIVPGEVRQQKIADVVEKQSDPFSTMLANAVNDSTILQKDITVVIPPQVANNDSSIVAINTDTSLAKSSISNTDSVTQKDVAKEIISPPDLKNDSTKIVAINRDTATAKLPVGISDSLIQKDVAKEIIPQVNLNSDSTKVVAVNNNNETKIELHQDTTQSSVSDNTVSPFVAKQKIKKKNKNDEVIDTGSIRKEAVKDTSLAINTDDIKTDSSQVKTAKSDLTTIETKQKIKKKKKDTAAFDSLAVQTEVPKLNDIVIKEKIKTDTLQNNLSDNTDSKTSAKQKVKKKKKNTEVADSVSNNDLVKEVNTVTDKVEKKTDTPPFINFKDETVRQRSLVKRKSKKNTKEGLEMMYVDDDGETKDTIWVLIPSEKKKRSEDENLTNFSGTISSPAEVKPEPKKEPSKEPESKLSMINSDCKSFATEEDFLKVRKKMVAENNDEDMVRAAKKVFKTKCFTTEQIKNLSVLFLKDEGKYMFFDAAYPFVSDSESYTTLQSQLSDSYYITRFKSMIHK